ncbi:MAG: carbohydrate kinase [Oscillospiraceae bacterium]|nr:carbohydrate kinase [Oscillospiraceae bacterium]
MYDVIALGELLIDFTRRESEGNPLFEANPGGAPCNVLAMLARLGRSTAFSGKVGDDMFGRMLKDAIEEAGISSVGLVKDPVVPTTLAFVQNAPDGDREFSFYRGPGADVMLRPEELPKKELETTRIFHFGSLSLTGNPALSATITAVRRAQGAGAIISFDPNLRESLWGDLDEAREQMLWGCSVCNVLKIAEEELAFLTGCEGWSEGAAQLRQKYPNIKLMLVTRGRGGSIALWQNHYVFCPAYTQVKAIDTTGAGDTFCGCCLHFVLKYGLEALDQEKLMEMLRFANAAAGLVTTRKGALRSMPTLEEVEALAAEGPKEAEAL